jgi:hypothetical protein
MEAIASYVTVELVCSRNIHDLSQLKNEIFLDLNLAVAKTN